MTNYAWQLTQSNLPFAMNAKDGLAGCVLNNRMIAIGGWKSGGGWNNMGITYNTVMTSVDGVTWTQSPKSMPVEGRHCFPAPVHKGRVYVLGGDANRGYYQPEVLSWDGDDTHDWVIHTLNAPWGNRIGHMAWSHGDYIYVGFGQTMTPLTPAPTQFFKDIWRWNPDDVVGWELVTEDAACGIRCFNLGGPAIKDGYAYFIAGGTYDTTDFGTREYRNDVYKMDLDTLEMTCVSHGKGSPLTKQMYHSVIVHDDLIWILGGFSGSDQRTCFYSADGRTWTQTATPPWAARHAAMAISFGDDLFFGTGYLAADMWKMKKVLPPPPGTYYGGVPNGTTALSNVRTCVDENIILTPGATVDKIGMHRMTAGNMTLKIVKQTAAHTFEVVYSQAVYHPGGGYVLFDITDFVVPSNGFNYRIGFALSFPVSDSYAFAGLGRWMTVGDMTGTYTSSYFSDGSFCYCWVAA